MIPEYLTYIEKLASEHIEIQHNAETAPRVFGPTWNDFTLRGNAPPVVVYIHPFEDPGEWNGAQMIESPIIGISILKPDNGSDKDRVVHEIYQECKEIARDFLRRMLYDRRINKECEKVVTYLQLKQYKIYQDGPHGDGYIGAALRVPTRYPVDSKHNPERWL